MRLFARDSQNDQRQADRTEPDRTHGWVRTSWTSWRTTSLGSGKDLCLGSTLLDYGMLLSTVLAVHFEVLVLVLEYFHFLLLCTFPPLHRFDYFSNYLLCRLPDPSEIKKNILKLIYFISQIKKEILILIRNLMNIRSDNKYTHV